MSELLAALLPLANKAAEFMTSSEGHNADPSGFVDYLIAGIRTVVVLVVIYASIDYFVRPREQEPDHIKRRILEEGP